MVCKNCGIANSDNSRFCSECGSALPQKKAEAVEAPAAEAVNTVPAPPAAPSPVPGVVPPMPSFAYSPPAFFGQVPQAVPPVMSMPVYVPPMAPPVPEAPAVQPVQEAAKIPEAPAAPQVNAPAFGAPVQQAGANPAMPSAQLPQGYPVPQLPYGQMPPFAYPSPLFKDPNATKVTWAMWLGIASAIIPLVTCIFGSPVSLVLAIVALCLGIVCVGRVYPQNKSKAIAAIVTGAIGLGVSILGISVLIRAFSSIADTDFMKEFQEYFDSFIAFMLAKVLKFAMIAFKAVMNQIQMMLQFLFLR